jgi:predicted PurR-regulated permease PerM
MAPFRPPEPSRRDPWSASLLLTGGVVAALYLGREVLAPLALALLLTIAALPVSAWLERRGVPRIAAVLLVLLLFLGLVGGLLYVVVGQALALAGELPRYESVLREKLQEIGQGSGPIEGVLQLGRRLSSAFAPAQAAPAATVMVAAAEEGPLATLFGIAVLVMAPIATLAITLLLMAFILVQREDVRDRVLRLAGLHEMHRTTGAMADATTRLGRFLLMQVSVNAAFGLSMGVGLWLLGVPNAPLWGALGFALRFVPYLGAPLSVLFPLVIAFATTEGWWTVLMVVALFAVVDIVVTYVLEPWLYGASTGISPLALLLSSAFWAVLWGPLGLVLAPAMTACLVILGRHVPAFAVLDVLLGDGEALPAPARFYQRVLADDAHGAARLLGAEVLRLGTPAALEQLVLPSIVQIGSDRPSESFGPALAIRSARALLRVLEPAGDEAEGGGAEILVLPVAGALDRAAAAALVALLTEAGQAATLRPERAPQPAILLLVAADAASPQRFARALAAGRRPGVAALGFAATPLAERAFADAGAALSCITTLPALLAAVAAALDQPAAHGAGEAA